MKTKETRIDKDRIMSVIQKLETGLWKACSPDQHIWAGRQWMNTGLTGEFLIMYKYIGLEDRSLIRSALQEIELNQQDDGGFCAYEGGPSEITTTAHCCLAMKLYREFVNESVLSRAERFLALHGGIRKALLISRFYHALFGLYPMHRIPKIRPGLLLVPSWTGLSFQDMAAWARSWFVPIAILWHYGSRKNPTGKKRWTPADNGPLPFWAFRKKGLRKAYLWILERQDKDGSWFSVFHSTMISLMALHACGLDLSDPVMQKGLRFIYSIQDNSFSRIRQMPFTSEWWDTAHSILALHDHGSSGTDHRLRNAFQCLLSHQSNVMSDWKYRCQAQPGGWGFELKNSLFPDCDTTALVTRALHLTESGAEQKRKGLDWMCRMQNSDGSWGAFNRNNQKVVIEWYLSLIRVQIGFGRGLILDYGTPDVTAHVIHTLAIYDRQEFGRMIEKAVRWLKRKQHSDGAWQGRWGTCYLYGTSAVLEALAVCGYDMSGEWIRKSVHFLVKAQNRDGGWGESPESFFRPELKGRGPSSVTQTAWVLSGLMFAGEIGSGAFKNGLQYLLEQIESGHEKKETLYQLAAPPLYHRYEFYPYYFPLITLKEYLRRNPDFDFHSPMND